MVGRRPFHPGLPRESIVRSGPPSRSESVPPVRTSRRCPEEFPGFRCRSTSRRSSDRTSSDPSPRVRQSAPRWPSVRPGWSWRSKRVGHSDAYGARRQPCRTAPGESIIRELAERLDDLLVALPVSRRFPSASIDDEIFRSFCDLWIEIVHQHSQGGFLHPALAGQRGTAGGANRCLHDGSLSSTVSGCCGTVAGQPFAATRPRSPSRADASPCTRKTCFGTSRIPSIQRSISFQSTWAEKPLMLRISALTLTRLPWIGICFSPSSNLRPRVPSAWYPTNSTRFLGSGSRCFR